MTDAASPPPLPSLAARCLDALESRDETLATAESLTAGLISATLAAERGASSVLRGGVAAYATEVKVLVLGVDDGVVQKHGVISSECAVAMAKAARSRFEATWGVSATGVAGPDRQEDRPVGTVYVAVAGPPGVRAEELSLVGSRKAIRDGSVAAALSLLLAALDASSDAGRTASDRAEG